MQHGAISQGRTHRAVQTVLEVDGALPLHGVGEEIAVEGGVLRQQAIQRQHRGGGDHFVESDLGRRDLRPVPIGQAVLGVWLALSHALEDHPQIASGAWQRLDVAMLARKTKGFSGADLKAMFDITTEQALARAMREGRVVPLTTEDLLQTARDLRPSAKAWFESAKNYALYANQSGFYDDVLSFLNLRK